MFSDCLNCYPYSVTSPWIGLYIEPIPIFPPHEQIYILNQFLFFINCFCDMPNVHYKLSFHCQYQIHWKIVHQHHRFHAFSVWFCSLWLCDKWNVELMSQIAVYKNLSQQMCNAHILQYICILINLQILVQ